MCPRPDCEIEVPDGLASEVEIARRARREVQELHAFFGHWYRASAEVGLERASSVLAPEFELLSPRGELLDRQRLLSELAAERGAFPGLRISVEDIRPVPLANGEVTVRYTEVHVERGQCERRSCCALLRSFSAAVNGLAWVAIDERWAVGSRAAP